MVDQITPFQQMLSACTGAVLTSLLMTPLDVVKTRLQAQSSPPISHPTSTFYHNSIASIYHKHAVHPRLVLELSHLPNDFFRIYPTSTLLQLNPGFDITASSRLHLTGTLDGMFKIARNEGVNALWRGLAPALLMSVPATVVYFVGYDRLKESFQITLGPQGDSYAPLLAGALARTIAATIISPLELLRTRMQALSRESSSKSMTRQVIDGLAHSVKKDGPRVLWRGLPPTLWRDVPFSAIYWSLYEYNKSFLMASQPQISPFGITFISGAAAGVIAAISTTPFDVAKTHQQTHYVKGGSLTLLAQILRKEGVAGLFRGIGPRIMKVGPACAIMISSYEFGKTFFANENDEKIRMVVSSSPIDETGRIAGLLVEEL